MRASALPSGITALEAGMCEAPKKIWLGEDEFWGSINFPNEEIREIQYIRADILEEMREALEEIIDAPKEEGINTKAIVNMVKIARAALKNLGDL